MTDENTTTLEILNPDDIGKRKIPTSHNHYYYQEEIDDGEDYIPEKMRLGNYIGLHVKIIYEGKSDCQYEPSWSVRND